MTGICYFCEKEGDIDKMYVLSSEIFNDRAYIRRMGRAEFDDYILCYNCSLKIKQMKKKNIKR